MSVTTDQKLPNEYIKKARPNVSVGQDVHGFWHTTKKDKDKVRGWLAAHNIYDASKELIEWIAWKLIQPEMSARSMEGSDIAAARTAEEADHLSWIIQGPMSPYEKLKELKWTHAYAKRATDLNTRLRRYEKKQDEYAEQAATVSAINFVSASEMAKKMEDTRKPVLNPMLRTGESMCVWAGVGVGKTWFTQTLALAAAGGYEFAGIKGEGVKVLVLDGEMDAYELTERMVDICDRQSWDKETCFNNLDYYLRTMQQGGALDMKLSMYRDKVISKAKDMGARLIVLDNLATLWQTESENDAAAFHSMNDFITECRGEGMAVLIVDHSNKAGTDQRGSSNKQTVLNVVCGLRKAYGGESGQASFSTHFSKWRGKHHTITDPKVFTLTDFGWQIETDEVATAQSKTERMYFKLTQGKYESLDALKDDAGRGSESSFNNLLAELKKIHKAKGSAADRGWYQSYFTGENFSDEGTQNNDF